MKYPLTLFLLILCFQANGKDLFDSLKIAYSDTVIWAKRSEYKKVGIESFLENEINKIHKKETRQIAIVAIVDNLYEFGWIKNQYLIEKLNEVLEDPVNSAVKELAISVKQEITKGLIEKKIQDINLPDHNGDSINMALF
jgi:isopentenyldiphosphate isomerase